MSDLPLIEQKVPTKFPGSIDLKAEEDKPQKQCKWIMEREPSKGQPCKNMVYVEGDEYCARHTLVTKNRVKKELRPPFDPTIIIDNPLPALLEVDDDLVPVEDEFLDLSLKKVPHSSSEQEAAAHFAKNDQDVIDILRCILMIRMKAAGLVSK